jgi:hypothetical protein
LRRNRGSCCFYFHADGQNRRNKRKICVYPVRVLPSSAP